MEDELINSTTNTEETTPEIVDESNDGEELESFDKLPEGDEEGDETNSSETEDGKKKESTKSQSKEKNHYYAELRRQQKAKLERQKYNEGLLAGTDGINPYTKKEMKDDLDIEEFENQKEMVKRGLDPIVDYADFLKEKRREESLKTLEAQKTSEWIAQDRQEFFKNNPDFTEDTFKELLDDTLFQTIAKGRAGKESINDIFQDYLRAKKIIDDKAKEKALFELAKKESSSKPLDSEQSSKEVNFTLEQIKKMSQEEVNEHYDEIQEWLAKQRK